MRYAIVTLLGVLVLWAVLSTINNLDVSLTKINSAQSQQLRELN